MSRIAKAAISIPAGVEVSISGNTIKAKGKLGEQSIDLHSFVKPNQEGTELTFDIVDVDKKDIKPAWAQAGTARALTANLIKGVSEGWEKKLTLIGVGYRAKAQGKVLNLTLGFSHPVNYELPEGVKADTPSQTEIVLTGMDKQSIGQAAANIRAFRPPEPYKGKGVRYSDEHVARKEAKKK
jgi:large subunit ribosomal protein L6